MNATAEIRRTAFYQNHKALGAKLVDFHGWELPIQYSSILKEHQAVRTRCGVFDVSHMGQVFVEGPKALEFLQWVNSNDIARAKPGKAVYSHMLNEKGGVVDDVIVSCLAPERFLVVVNAATTEKDFKWLQSKASRFDVKLSNQSDDFAMLAVQGPWAHKVMAELQPGSVSLPRFGVIEGQLFGQRSIIQRTGYTGEDGFEILIPTEIASRLWDQLMTKGQSYGITPCGLGSRDTLRLEAGFLLYGQDVDDNHTPLEAGYDWVVKFEKGEFIGKKALVEQKEKGLARRMAGVKLIDKGVPRPGTPVIKNGKELGTLCSATFSPSLQIGIGQGYFPAGLKAGEKVDVSLHGRMVPAQAASIPFYTTPKE